MYFINIIIFTCENPTHKCRFVIYQLGYKPMNIENFNRDRIKQAHSLLDSFSCTKAKSSPFVNPIFNKELKKLYIFSRIPAGHIFFDYHGNQLIKINGN